MAKLEQIDPDDPLWRTAVFGKQVADFMDSDIGMYLLKMADYEAEQAMRKLKVCDVRDTSMITDLQNQIWRAENFRNWLELALRSGDTAKEVLTEEHG